MENQHHPALSVKMLKAMPWNILIKFIMFVVYFLTSVLIVRSLGPKDYGVYSLCKNAMQYFVILIGLGLNNSVLRFLPELNHHKNVSGIKKFIIKASFVQFISALFMGVIALIFKDYFDWFFKIDFKYYLVITVLLSYVFVYKDFLYNVFTSFYQAKLLALTTLINGILWPLIYLVFMQLHLKVGGALMAEALSMILIVVILAANLYHTYWKSNDIQEMPGIGLKRVGMLSFTFMATSIMNLIISKQSEVFYLGYFYGPETVGYYNLGCTLPQFGLTFIPLAIYGLFTAGFSEMYVKDQSKLGQIVSSYYKMLILGIIPIAIFGIAFFDIIIPILYGHTMLRAAPIAQIYSFLHVLPFISVPLSMAITAKEKPYLMLPFQLMQVALNVTLNYFLIKHFAVQGAILAFFLTFALTIPWRLLQVRKIIGGIYFPLAFFLRTLKASAFTLLLLPLKPYCHNLPGLIGLGLTFAGLMLVSFKYFEVIQKNDLDTLGLSGRKKLEKVLKFFIHRKYLT